METVDLSVFKKFSLLMGVTSIGIVCLILFGTYIEISHNFWQEQGTTRAVLIGLSLSAIFMIYAILCFKAFKIPTVKNTSIIYGIQSILFFILMVLAWVAIFLPAY